MSTRPGLARGGGRVKATIAMLYLRDGPKCRRCGFHVDRAKSGMDPMGPTIGHILAAAHGGTDRADNLGLEHRSCNLAASSRPTPPRATIASPL
jgi:5-methylcytosine-specific restriction endonuclease McrA